VVVREEERKEWVENFGQAMTVVYTSHHVHECGGSDFYIWRWKRHNQPEAKEIPNESRTIVVFHQ